MDDQKKIAIANSFTDAYDQVNLDITLSTDELFIFKQGIFSTSMDEKWNVFLLDDQLFISRSWTDKCTYVASIETNPTNFTISKLKISRDTKLDLKTSIEWFNRLLQIWLKRDDLFVDERLSIGKIREIVESYPDHDKLVSTSTLGFTLDTIHGLLESSSDFVNIIGFDDFQRNTYKYSSNYELIRLHISQRYSSDNNSATFYFTNDGLELVGHIKIQIK